MIHLVTFRHWLSASLVGRYSRIEVCEVADCPFGPMRQT